jgi:hypothetical protein
VALAFGAAFAPVFAARLPATFGDLLAAFFAGGRV